MVDDKPDLERRLDRLRAPFRAFVVSQTTASGVLLAALIGALLIANSPWATDYRALQHYPLGVLIGHATYDWSLLHVVNDGLIAFFFFLIGLEIKRELLAGELQDRRRVWLLLGAAGGGMLVPATLYYLINATLPGGHVDGWGIPMATDTAIAIGVLAALGSRAPHSVVAFLVGLAIIDDIGAILVIALVYTEQVSPGPLGLAAALFVLLLLVNRAGLRHPLWYVVAGIALWVAIVRSGVHASIAGVVVAATVPARPRASLRTLKERVRGAAQDVTEAPRTPDVLAEEKAHRQVVAMEEAARLATTPLRRWEDRLELPIALLVLPLFAFLNAGIDIDTASLTRAVADPVVLGIAAGLLLGKPVGIIGGVWLVQRLGLASRPEALTGRRLLGVGLLAGVGFTMSTFIANLALAGDANELDRAKLAIVLASAVAAVLGYGFMRLACREH